MALDEEAGLVPDGEAERAHRAGHVAAAKPGFGAVDELGRDLGVGGLEHAPLADSGAHMLEDQSVDLG